MTRGEFAEAVYTYCTLLGGSVTSWIRTDERNRGVNGVEHSPHLVGLGADVEYDSPPTFQVRAEWAGRLELRLILEDDHDHLQPLDWRAG